MLGGWVACYELFGCALVWVRWVLLCWVSAFFVRSLPHVVGVRGFVGGNDVFGVLGYCYMEFVCCF